eukprot:sb/3478837/
MPLNFRLIYRLSKSLMTTGFVTNPVVIRDFIPFVLRNLKRGVKCEQSERDQNVPGGEKKRKSENLTLPYPFDMRCRSLARAFSTPPRDLGVGTRPYE